VEYNIVKNYDEIAREKTLNRLGDLSKYPRKYPRFIARV